MPTAKAGPGGLLILPNVLTDRGSRYAVAGGPAQSEADAAALLKELKRNKKFAKATHNSWGLLLSDDTMLKGDDGEAGAGMVILRMFEREKIRDTMVIVTRWYGGKHLGGDRFRHVQSCVDAFLQEWRA